MGDSTDTPESQGQREDALARRLIQRVAAASPELMAVVDQDYVYRFVNDAYTRAHGLPAERIVGMHIAALLGDDVFGDVVQGALDRCLSGHEIQYEAWFDFAAAGHRYMAVQYLPLLLPDGEIDAVAVLCTDITDRKEAEEALRQSETKYRDYISGAPNGVFVVDSLGRYCEVNAAACRMTGYSEAELLSMTIADAVHPEDAAEIGRRFQRLTVTGSYADEFRMRRKDGSTVWVSLNATALGEDHFIGFCDDITERRQIEAQLRQSQKLEALGRLAGGVAHDFNNLLTAIVGRASLAERELAEGSSAREHLGAIHEASRRAASMTRNLLAFGRSELRHPSTFSINDTIDDVRQLFARLIGESIEFTTSFDPDAGSILADQEEFERVLVNLVMNARDAMVDGGRLQIITRRTPLSAADAEQRSLTAGDYVVIEVTDSGSGIPPHVLPRIFDPFFTTKPPGQGSGLGLSAVYGTVRQSGGFVEVTSEPGCTRFSLYFPSVEHQDQADGQARETEMTGGDETILVVEDEQAVRSLVIRVLESIGYQVLSAPSPIEAKDIVSAKGSSIDLILSDVVMPGSSGPTFVAECRDSLPDLRVLFMSGYSDEFFDQLVDSKELLHKPFTPAMLAKRVRQELDAQR